MAIKEKYINLFTDFGFKRVFGEEANKDLLMDFLNQVLPKTYTVQELNFSKNEQMGKAVEGRKAIFDIYCTSTKGEHFVVELQYQSVLKKESAIPQLYLEDRSNNPLNKSCLSRVVTNYIL